MRSAAEGEHRTGADRGLQPLPPAGPRGRLCVGKRRVQTSSGHRPMGSTAATVFRNTANARGARPAIPRRSAAHFRVGRACAYPAARSARNARAAWRWGGFAASPAVKTKGPSEKRAPQRRRFAPPGASRFSPWRKGARSCDVECEIAPPQRWTSLWSRGGRTPQSESRPGLKPRCSKLEQSVLCRHSCSHYDDVHADR
jgi:hypothetical protein